MRRRRSALWVTVALLALSLLVLTIGLISATRTDNVPVAGYYPGIIVSLRPLVHSPFLVTVFVSVSAIFVPAAELWSVPRHGRHPPGGKPQADGESSKQADIGTGTGTKDLATGQ